MSLEESYYVSQILSTVAVVASLIYLALQTRQTGLNQKAQMHESRSLWVRHEARLLGEPSVNTVMRRGISSDMTMNEQQIEQFYYHATSFYMSWEEQFRQKREGMIDDARWSSTEGYIRIFLQSPGWRAVAKLYVAQQRIDPAFAALVSRLLKEIKPAKLVAIAEVWKSLVTEDLATMNAVA